MSRRPPSRLASALLPSVLLVAGCSPQAALDSDRGDADRFAASRSDREAEPTENSGRPGAAVAEPPPVMPTNLPGLWLPEDDQLANAQPVRLTGSRAALNPDNSSVELALEQLGDLPAPRIGTFRKFTGDIRIDDLASVTLHVDIQTPSIKIGAVEDLLQNSDFFGGQRWTLRVTGQASENVEQDDQTLTLRGQLSCGSVTRSVAFEAFLDQHPDGVSLTADLELNRADWDLRALKRHFDDRLRLTISVGRRAQSAPSAPMFPGLAE